MILLASFFVSSFTFCSAKLLFAFFKQIRYFNQEHSVSAALTMKRLKLPQAFQVQGTENPKIAKMLFKPLTLPCDWGQEHDLQE